MLLEAQHQMHEASLTMLLAAGLDPGLRKAQQLEGQDGNVLLVRPKRAPLQSLEL